MGKGIPYSATENLLLIELVQKYSLVENKKTDSTSIHEKNKAWERITEEFNATGDHSIVSSNFFIYLSIV